MSQPHADLNASSSVKLSRRSHRRTLLAPGTSGIAHSWRSFAAKGNSYQGVAWMKAAYSVATPRMKRGGNGVRRDRKSTRLNSSHLVISYAVFCLKKKKKQVYTGLRHN